MSEKGACGVRWELRLRAAERGIFKAVEMRRLMAQAGLRVSAGKMSALWSTIPVSVRLDDLQVLCRVLGCDAAGLLALDPEPEPSPDLLAPASVLASGVAAAAASAGQSAPAPASAPRDLEPAEGAGRGGVVRPSLPPV